MTYQNFGVVNELTQWYYYENCLTITLFFLLFSHPVRSNSAIPRSMPGFPVYHHLLEFAQVRVHCIGDAITSSHPLMPCSPSALNLSPPQDLSNESAVRIRWPKYWSFSFGISPPKEHSGLISFKIDWFELFAVQGTLRSLLQHHSSKVSRYQFFGGLPSLKSSSHSRMYMTTGRTIALTVWIFVSRVMSLFFNTV